jgi:hypothetical protein
MATEPTARGESRAFTIIGWTLTGLVGAFLAFSASLKFLTPDMVRATMVTLEWPVQHDLLIGVLEAVAVVLFLFPRTAILGAILETAILGGAIATHLRIGSPLFSHTLFGVYLGLMVWGGLWFRSAAVRALIPFRL